MVYSTYLGGSAADQGMGIAVDSGGSAYITGYTQSPDFPVRNENAYLSTARGAADPYSGCPPTAFATKLSADGQSLAYSTFPGGSVEATPQVSGVLNVDGAKLIAPASWIAIYGTDLSTTTTDWTGDITPAGDLPTQLARTSVTVNGKTAYVYSVSPTQVNAVAPDDGTVGNVPVVVTVNGTPSVAVNAALNPVSPALFLWPRNYVVATHLDYSPAAKNGVLPGETTQTAAPGEIIILWGAGLGPVTPPAPACIVTQVAGYVQTPVTVFFGTVAQTAIAAALTPRDAALYRIAVTVPSTLASGDYPIGLEVNGDVGSTGLLTVAPH